MQPRLRIAAFFLVLAGTALVAGQNAPPPDLQTPTFRAEVEYVEVDAVVTDNQGQFVRDLKKEDFQVSEDGKAQTITAFSLVDIPVDKPDRPLFASAPIEPDVQSNERPFDGRVYVMILDDLHTAALRSQRVKMAARQFIERNLGANDLMAIVETGGRSDAAQEFTSNRRLLLSAVDKFIGRKLDSVTISKNDAYYRQGGVSTGSVLDPDEMERAHNAQSTLRSVRQVAEWFGGVRNRRKTILFVSEGIDYDIYEVIRDYNLPASRASDILDEIRETISATARSNVSIYSIDPRGLTDLSDESITVGSFAGSDPVTSVDGVAVARPDIGLHSLANDLQRSQDSLRALAEETGGFAAVNTNEFASAFARVVRDNSSYYVLAYYPPSTKRDGKFHRIQVKLARQGLTVRARRGYASPKGKAPVAKPVTNGPSPKLQEALNSPMQLSGLKMRVFAAPFKGTAPNASVLLAVEMHGRDLELSTNSKLEISYVAVDAKGKSQSKTDRVTLNLKPETRALVEQTGLRTLTRLDLLPGRYQLRVGAYDATGDAVGSVIQDLEIPEFTKLPFTMSGLVLTSPSGAQIATVRPDESLRDILPGPPSALRTFFTTDELVAFAEIYDNQGSTPHKVDIVTTLTSDTGTVVAKLAEERESTELQGKSGGYGYLARLPLGQVAPGTYVLATQAKSRLGEQTATRQVMLRVVAPLPQNPQ